MVCRYCVLLITGEDQAFLPGNKAFLDFASTNRKEVLRFAYVYQRQQQPLCQALLHNQAALSPQVSDRHTRAVLNIQESKPNFVIMVKNEHCYDNKIHLTFIKHLSKEGCGKFTLNKSMIFRCICINHMLVL